MNNKKISEKETSETLRFFYVYKLLLYVYNIFL